MKNILVVVDMQNDFIDGSLGNANNIKVIKSVIREIESGNYDGFLLTRDTHQENYLNTLEGKNLPVKHCIYNTDGWNINQDIMKSIIASSKPYKILDKKGFGSFTLIEELDTYQELLQSITVVGLCTEICVIANALMLKSKFINTPIYYVEDATEGLSVKGKEAALTVLNSCQIYKRG